MAAHRSNWLEVVTGSTGGRRDETPMAELCGIRSPLPICQGQSVLDSPEECLASQAKAKGLASLRARGGRSGPRAMEGQKLRNFAFRGLGETRNGP